jgi:uncharacterized protein (TIGR03067 family)
MRAILVCGLGLLLANAATGGDTKGELAKLQGKWTADKAGKKIELKFDKDKFTISFEGKAFAGTFKIDPSKTPKHMDLTITEVDPTVTEGQKFVGKTALAIYAMDGDSLKWVASEPGKEDRPSAFPDKEGEVKGHLYLVFKRAK